MVNPGLIKCLWYLFLHAYSIFKLKRRSVYSRKTSMTFSKLTAVFSLKSFISVRLLCSMFSLSPLTHQPFHTRFHPEFFLYRTLLHPFVNQSSWFPMGLILCALYYLLIKTFYAIMSPKKCPVTL